MMPLTIILISAIIYAFIRAKHDSYLKGGEWKTWAFIEGFFWGALVVALTLLSFSLDWWVGFVLGPIFAFTFWLFFDCIVGYHFTGNILYLGEKGFDLKMRKMFLYNKPIFGWKETGQIRGIFFKGFWLVLLIGAYFSFI